MSIHLKVRFSFWWKKKKKLFLDNKIYKTEKTADKGTWCAEWSLSTTTSHTVTHGHVAEVTCWLL